MRTEIQIPEELRTYSLKAIAKADGVHERTLRRQLDEVGIPVIRIGRTPRLTHGNLKRFRGIAG